MQAGRAGARPTTWIVAAIGISGLALLCCQNLLAIDGAIVIADAGMALPVEGGVDAGPDVPDVVAPTQACGLPVEANECQQCVASHCCSEATACAGDLTCASLEGCLLQCGGDYGCRASCVLDHPVGPAVDVPTLDACVSNHCTSQCGLVCGVPGSYTAPDAAGGCQSCIARTDCTQTAACTGNLQCELTGHCAYSCSTQDCRNACLLDDDAGFSATAFDQLPCLDPCQVGSYWACLGRVSFPFAKGPTSDVTLIVNDAQTGAIAGIDVKACRQGEDPCNPLGSGTTDSTGRLTLTLPDPAQNAAGFWGYFDLSSPAQPPAIVPYLYFLSFPLSEPHATLQLTVESPPDFDSQLALVGLAPENTSHGTVVVGTTDCLLLPANKATVTVEPTDALTNVAYLSGNSLSKSATATDHSGTAFVINAPRGAVSVRVTPGGLSVVSSLTNLFVRPGTISFIEGLPTP